MTIGIEKMVRSQQRAAQHGRSRNNAIREGRTPATWDGVDETAATCELCGVETRQRDLFHTEGGAACPTCFGEHAADHALTLHHPVRDQLAKWAAPLPAVGVAALMGAAVMWGSASTFSDKAGMGWVLCACLGLLLAVITSLNGLRGLRSDLRPVPLSDDEPIRISKLAVAADVWALSTGISVAVAVPILAALPYM